MSSSSKTTEEERLALATKLDKELDEFIDGLEKKRYEDGWPEDRWEEEMAKHPFFMKTVPGENEELSPLMEGLQKLKYDPEENTPVELAVNYKEDGNFNFKHKKYRLAILGYTEGIKIKCDNDEVNANLYNNRAASHYFLGNYRSSLADCEKALSFIPTYSKALARAAECALKIFHFDLCFKYCDQMIAQNFDKDNAVRMKREAEKKKIITERDQRKKEFTDRKKAAEEKSVIEAITSRGIKMEKSRSGECINLSDLEPCFPGVVGSRVHMSPDNNILVWPVLFLYPEYKMTDFIQECWETSTLSQHLEEMFSVTPVWDADGVYKPYALNIYYEGPQKYKIFKTDPEKTLLEIMKEPNFELRAGTPSFIVLVKESVVEKSFLKSCYS